jgi:hypothetical protein
MGASGRWALNLSPVIHMAGKDSRTEDKDSRTEDKDSRTEDKDSRTEDKDFRTAGKIIRTAGKSGLAKAVGRTPALIQVKAT